MNETNNNTRNYLYDNQVLNIYIFLMQPKFRLQGISFSAFSILREDVVKKACPAFLIF